MPLPLEGTVVALLAADGVEQMELDAPILAARQAGADTRLVSASAGAIRAFQDGERTEDLTVEETASATRASDYGALVIPGGAASIDALRTSGAVLHLVRDFVMLGRPIAAIGDGPALLVAADAVRGRTLTSSPDVRDAIVRAGGSWRDAPAVLDQRLLTGRGVSDIRSFCAKLVDLLIATTQNEIVDEASEQSFPASDAPAWGPSAIGGAARREGQRRDRRDDE